MNIIINVDDYGRSKSITDSILKCVDDGMVTRVSIFPNGEAFKYALSQYKKRKNLKLAIHLDLVECTPLSPLEDIPHLVNRSGLYKYSFITLWVMYLLGSKNKKKKLRRQIKSEIRAQIQKVVDNLESGFDIELDSHMHMHMIPFVFDVMLELKKEFNISYIRISKEPFFIHVTSFKDLKSYIGPNLLKHLLLKILSARNTYKLDKHNISYCRHFIGILFTGKMNVSIVQSALKAITKCQDDEIVEILFHPGKADRSEGENSDEPNYIMDYYLSEDRNLEKKALLDKRLPQIIKRYSSMVLKK